MARVQVIARLIKPLLKNSNSSIIKVMDIGCGDGFLMAQLAGIFPALQFIGIDSAFSEGMLDQLNQVQNNNRCLFVNSLEHTPSGILPVDLILLLDVLEHLDTETPLLEQILPLLRLNGLVLVTVPAYQTLFCQHDQWLGHYRRYSGKQLSGLLEQFGLKILQRGYFFSWLLIPRLLFKYRERWLGPPSPPPTGIGKWRGGVHLSRICSGLLCANAWLDLSLQKLNFPIPGLSLVALCQKSA